MFGHALSGPADLLETRPILSFAGLDPVEVPSINRETHLAEKLHAYTAPRETQNSRVKDLPDIAILASLGPLDGRALAEAIVNTFRTRRTHDVPLRVPAPPDEWRQAYERMAKEAGLPWTTLDAVTDAVATFLDPVLQRRAVTWSPERWSW